MDSSPDGCRQTRSVILDLPQRLKTEEIVRLNAAVARAPLARHHVRATYSDDEIKGARDFALASVELRRAREREFDGLMFSDPSWDLLLILLVRRVDGHSTSVSGACNGIGVPPSTAFRHLSILVEQGWVTRRPSETDPGVFYVEMTDSALDRMVGLLRPNN